MIERIVVNAAIMGGKPVIKGTRLTVEYVLKRLSAGATEIDLQQEYPGLTAEDIKACLLYASKCVDGMDVFTLGESA